MPSIIGSHTRLAVWFDTTTVRSSENARPPVVPSTATDSASAPAGVSGCNVRWS